MLTNNEEEMTDEFATEFEARKKERASPAFAEYSPGVPKRGSGLPRVASAPDVRRVAAVAPSPEFAAGGSRTTPGKEPWRLKSPPPPFRP